MQHRVEMDSGDVTSDGGGAAEAAPSADERRRPVERSAFAPGEHPSCFEEECSSSVVYVPPATGELSLSLLPGALTAEERQSSVELLGMARGAGLAGALDEDGMRMSRPAPLALRLGVRIGGKYRLMRRLASGSMGSVWCAEHVVLEALVAIKFMQPVVDPSGDLHRRFLREARVASAVRSPHVVQVLDYGVLGDTPYIVMEFLCGESLADRLGRLGRLTPGETARLLAPLGPALARAHELGVVHRDLKPENIFIVREGVHEYTKLIDFGVAKVFSRKFGVTITPGTREGEIVGTPHYMSPEQARGADTVDHRADVWALGVIAFECLLGRPPFRGANLATLVLQICAQPLPVPSALGSVPEGFDAWFAQACARAPEDRHPSAKEAMLRLEHVCSAPVMTASAAAPAMLAARVAESAQAGSFASPRARRLAALLGLLLGALALWLAFDVGAIRARLFDTPSAEREARLGAAFAPLSPGLGRHLGELAPERRAVMSSARPGHAPPPGSPAAPYVGPSEP